MSTFSQLNSSCSKSLSQLGACFFFLPCLFSLLCHFFATGWNHDERKSSTRWFGSTFNHFRMKSRPDVCFVGQQKVLKLLLPQPYLLWQIMQPALFGTISDTSNHKEWEVLQIQKTPIKLETKQDKKPGV